MPQDPHERAMIRFWTKFAEEKVGDYCLPFSYFVYCLIFNLSGARKYFT